MQAEFLLSREQNRRLEVGDGKNRSYRFHFHSHIEICVVTEGQIEVWINDQRRVLGPGEIAVAWSYDAHSYRTVGESRSLSLIIPPDFFVDLLPTLGQRQVRESFLADPFLFEKLSDAIHSIIETKSEITRRGYVYVILGHLLERVPFEASDRDRDLELTSRVLLYLNQFFREELTLGQVAQALGYHPSYLSRMFKSTLQIGFNRYLTVLRLREAILLLREGDRTVTAAALESGFQSLRSFYRAFQSEFGCTPREYMGLISPNQSHIT